MRVVRWGLAAVFVLIVVVLVNTFRMPTPEFVAQDVDVPEVDAQVVAELLSQAIRPKMRAFSLGTDVVFDCSLRQQTQDPGEARP